MVICFQFFREQAQDWGVKLNQTKEQIPYKETNKPNTEKEELL